MKHSPCWFRWASSALVLSPSSSSTSVTSSSNQKTRPTAMAPNKMQCAASACCNSRVNRNCARAMCRIHCMGAGGCTINGHQLSKDVSESAALDTAEDFERSPATPLPILSPPVPATLERQLTPFQPLPAPAILEQQSRSSNLLAPSQLSPVPATSEHQLAPIQPPHAPAIPEQQYHSSDLPTSLQLSPLSATLEQQLNSQPPPPLVRPNWQPYQQLLQSTTAGPSKPSLSALSNWRPGQHLQNSTPGPSKPCYALQMKNVFSLKHGGSLLPLRQQEDAEKTCRQQQLDHEILAVVWKLVRAHVLVI
jgi:hypothetical protein